MRASLFNYATLDELYKMHQEGYEFTINDGEIKNAIRNQKDDTEQSR